MEYDGIPDDDLTDLDDYDLWYVQWDHEPMEDEQNCLASMPDEQRGVGEVELGFSVHSFKLYKSRTPVYGEMRVGGCASCADKPAGR